MKILGDPIFAKNADGTLKSRIGTLFFRTPGLVTQRGVHAYARVVLRREQFVDDFAAFAKSYVLAFERALAAAQSAYRARRRAFDELFVHRPFDEAGSGAYRWSCILRRLDACDPHAVAEALKKAIQS